jgi:hypothetical protein
METREQYPRVKVRCVWSWPSGRGSGTDEVPGWVVTPGLAVVDFQEMADTDRHWSVVQMEAGEIMITNDLCEECAFAAARVLAEVPGWNRPVDVLKGDDTVGAAVEMAAGYGPCFPPPDAVRAFAAQFGLTVPLRVAGHQAGLPYQRPEGVPPGMGMLVPADMDDLPEMPPEMIEQLQKAADQQNRPWYEQED